MRKNLKVNNLLKIYFQVIPRQYLTQQQVWELLINTIFQKRKIYEQTGLFDERFTFWYADNDYSETIKKLGIKHALVLNSVVEHIESKTLNGKDSNTKRKLTIEQKKIFDLKWKNKR